MPTLDTHDALAIAERIDPTAVLLCVMCGKSPRDDGYLSCTPCREHLRHPDSLKPRSRKPPTLTPLPKPKPKEEPRVEPVPKAEVGYPCPECGKVLQTKQGLGSHRFRSHGVAGPNSSARPKQGGEFTCPKCDATFASAWGLKIHIDKTHYVRQPALTPDDTAEAHELSSLIADSLPPLSAADDYSAYNLTTDTAPEPPSQTSDLLGADHKVLSDVLTDTIRLLAIHERNDSANDYLLADALRAAFEPSRAYRAGVIARRWLGAPARIVREFAEGWSA